MTATATSVEQDRVAREVKRKLDRAPDDDKWVNVCMCVCVCVCVCRFDTLCRRNGLAC